MRALGWLFALIFVAGCGSASPPEISDDDQPDLHAREQAPPLAEPDGRPAIVAFGDSISAGYGVRPDQAYPAQLEKMLNEANYRYQVINEGINGDTTSGGRTRVPAILALKPELVILELGGNDGLRGLPVETTRANLEEVIKTLKDAGIQVVLVGMTLPPNYGPDYISSFEKIYPEVAATHGITLIPFQLSDVRGHMQDDDIHPDSDGHRIVAAKLMAAITPHLTRSRQ